MRVQHVTEATLQTTVQQGIVLLDWWATWCGPCRAFGPIFEAASERHPDVVFGKVNTEDQPGLAATFDVRSIPTVMAFRDGVLLYSRPGLLSAAQVDDLIAKIRAVDMEDVRRRAETVKAPAAAVS